MEQLLEEDLKERPAATVSEKRRFLDDTVYMALSASTVKRLLKWLGFRRKNGLLWRCTDDKVYITKSRTGKRVDEDKMLEEIEVGFIEDERKFEVSVRTMKPELTIREAEKLKPTKRLGNYRTSYTLATYRSPERVENLSIDSGAISGEILAAGEVFSVNAVAEPLEYYETKVIIEGREALADGDGLCQVFSTLYMAAANYTGLDIVERSPPPMPSCLTSGRV